MRQGWHGEYRAGWGFDVWMGEAGPQGCGAGAFRELEEVSGGRQEHLRAVHVAEKVG